MTLKLKRVYEAPSDDDGYRILVDRVWPRGVSEESAHAQLWLRRIAPSDELRTWFGHDPERWSEFRTRYERELSEHPDLLDLIGDIERHSKTVTLLYGAADEEHNQAVVLRDALRHRSMH